MTDQKMKCSEIEIAVAKMFGYRGNVIVPNVIYGAGLHECDLLVINKNNYATEVEIKVSKQDLKADFKKKHGHQNIKIKHLYYAIPDYLLQDAISLIPHTHAGIIVCTRYPSNPGVYAKIHRKALRFGEFRAMTHQEVANIGRLAAIRMWNLKIAKS